MVWKKICRKRWIFLNWGVWGRLRCLAIHSLHISSTFAKDFFLETKLLSGFQTTWKKKHLSTLAKWHFCVFLPVAYWALLHNDIWVSNLVALSDHDKCNCETCGQAQREAGCCWLRGSSSEALKKMGLARKTLMADPPHGSPPAGLVFLLRALGSPVFEGCQSKCCIISNICAPAINKRAWSQIPVQHTALKYRVRVGGKGFGGKSVLFNG